MADIDECKDYIARERGYPDWEAMENFIIDHNPPVNVALLLVSAMTEVCYEYYIINQPQRL